MKTTIERGRLALGRRWTTGTLALLVGVAACDTDSLLEVPDPDVVSVPVFEDPTNLPAVRAGVIREFARAFAGTQNGEGGQIIVSGTLADEIYHSGTFTDRQEVDARETTLTNGSNTTAFFWLQRARNHAEQAEGLFAASDDAGGDGHAEVTTLAGFSYVIVGENYCSGVPFSTIPIQGRQEFGSPRSTDEIFGLAVDRFDAAMAFGPGADIMNLARVGKGRALLNLGQYEDAAQAVAQVPTGFRRVVAYSDAVLPAYNAVWNLVNAERRWSAAGSEGTNGLPFLTSGDPRTPAEFDGPAFDNRVGHYSQLAYPSPGTDIPLATGVEARLIEAEAALRSGDRSTFFSKHNEIRATMALDAFTDEGQSEDELVDLHFRERAYWMWLTSHRLGDLRRLVRQYGRASTSVYPIGLTELGEARGDHLSLPVPFNETNNPNYDTSACDPTGA